MKSEAEICPLKLNKNVCAKTRASQAWISLKSLWQFDNRPPSIVYRPESIVWVLAHFEYVYSYFEKGCRKKCTRQPRKVLWVVLSSMFFKEMWRNCTRGHGRLFASAKESKKKKVGSTATGTVYWSYPIVPFGIVACTFLPTTFLKIAVYRRFRASATQESLRGIWPFVFSRIMPTNSMHVNKTKFGEYCHKTFVGKTKHTSLRDLSAWNRTIILQDQLPLVNYGIFLPIACHVYI